MTDKNKKILIVGAGPTGLTAAIELYRRGFTPRIIDRKAEPSPLSRAVGINAHSLDLLEESGVTDALLERGHQIGKVRIHENGKVIGTIHMDTLPHRFNFLLALPQNETEEVMSDVLASHGGTVEYGHEMSSYEVTQDGKALVSINGAAPEEFDMVIGADGAHSKLREAAEIAFNGHDYDTNWSIADFESEDWDASDDINDADMFLLPGGHIRFVVRIGENRYRAVADQPEALAGIPVNFTLDRLNRADDFQISVRQAETYQKAPLYLAGDAAHVHSPAGGRGMNMGIADAHDLARRIADDDLDGYTASRHPDAKQWLEDSERMVKMATASRPVSKMLRRTFLAAVSAFPFIQKSTLKKISGISDAPQP